MTEERIIETHTPSGNTHTTRTVIRDQKRSGSGWLIGLIVVVAIGVAIWFFSQQSQSEIARDNAVAGAAGQVGEAAGEVGEAAQRAADSVDGRE